MKREFTFICLILLAIISWIFLNRHTPHMNVLSPTLQKSLLEIPAIPTTTKPPTEIVIAVVACGMRLQETLNMLKSAIIFNSERIPMHFSIVTEPNLMQSFTEKLDDWKTITQNLFTFNIFPPKFPTKNTDNWRNLFKPCAAQRLFLPSLLKHIDSVIYVDTDVLFLSPISQIWNFFNKFNNSQMAALTPEHEDRNVGWYNRFAKHPYYPPLGVNSGVMLMNLTRMRAFKWEDYMLLLYNEYKLKITFGDQDLINILFYYHQDKLYLLSCEWNYRPDLCMYMDVCKSRNGVKILHGNRGYFHADKQPAFKVAYRIVEEYKFGTDLYRNFLQSFESELADETVRQTTCGKIADSFLIEAKKLFKEADYYYNTSV